MPSPRLSPTSYLVLGLLEWLGPASPYDLKLATARSVGNFWSFPHSQLYAEPKRLLAAGLVTEDQETGGRRRLLYSISPAGRKTLAEWLADPDASGWEVRDPGLLKLFFGDLTDPTNVAELARRQESAHASRLKDYENLMKELESLAATSQVKTLRMGIAYERASVRFWREMVKEFAS